MKIFINKIAISVLTLACLNSCKKFVQLEPPITSLVTSSVFTDNSKATAAQLAIYAQMQTYPWSIDWATGLSSDELKNYVSSNQTAIDLYSNTLNAATDASKIGLWSQAYNFIYEANSILESLPKSTGITDAVRQQLTGESKFIRAYWNFYLVNLYGDIPLILTTDYTVNTKQDRTSKTQVYQQIINDLTDAESLLNSNFVDATDTVITTERVRPTKWAATALLARAYLHIGDWGKSESHATTLINNTSLFSLPTNLDSVFLKNNREAIWQLLPNSNNKYTPEGAAFILTSNPATAGGSYTTTLSDQLLKLFETGDLRKTKWVGTFKSGTSSWNFPNKYKASVTSISLTEYSMVLRLAEQYLIRAEARAQQSILTGANSAVSDLNIIRQRAGLLNYSGLTDKTSVLSAIMQERQVELFTEGHRWLDLKRTNAVDVMMPAITAQKGGSWKSYQQFYPVPPADVQNSAGIIIQNDGY